MRSSRSLPSAGVSRDDLPAVARIFEADGPYLSVYLDTEAAVANAAQKSELHWKDLRRELTASDVPEAMLAAVDPVVGSAHLFGETLGVVVASDGSSVVGHGPGPPTHDLGRLSSLPSVAPLLEWAQRQPPHLTVLIDHTGADVLAVGPDNQTRVEAVGKTEAHDPHLHRAGPGGWSQPHYQHKAENLWATNARAVAERVERIAGEVRARVVFVAGDVRARQLLRDALPVALGDLVRELDGSRAPDGSAEHLAEEARQAVADSVAGETSELMAAFHHHYDQGGPAMVGARDVVAALAGTQVGTLVIPNALDDERTAWFGPTPEAVALAHEELVALGVQRPLEARLPDALIRAAWGTGADVHVASEASALPDGIGALVRFGY